MASYLVTHFLADLQKRFEKLDHASEACGGQGTLLARILATVGAWIA